MILSLNSLKDLEIKQVLKQHSSCKSPAEKKQTKKKTSCRLSALSTITPDHVDSRVMQQVS